MIDPEGLGQELWVKRKDGLLGPVLFALSRVCDLLTSPTGYLITVGENGPA